jgi:hydrogenase expression/formation protein HypD
VKYLDEFRDPRLAREILRDIKQIVTTKWVIMEICGGQTHSIIRNGIDQALPKNIELVHGPGCPVCVTPLEIIDKAIKIAALPNIIFTSFGDMLRVPGSKKDLLMAKSEGADIRTVYSPLESLKIARENPEKEIVFFAVGFETTAPGNAMAIHQAAKENLQNYSQLVSHVLVPPAMRALLSSPSNRVQGYLAAGHVCTIMGLSEYQGIANEYKVPIVATGFEPLDLLGGILRVIKQLEEGRHEVENEYSRVVNAEGNIPAQKLISEVYTVVNRKWRGIGEIPESGLGLTQKFRIFDAEKRFTVSEINTKESDLCISGEVLQGLKKPNECSAFDKECTPVHPLGATMVSSEGACAAYYKYQRHKVHKS